MATFLRSYFCTIERLLLFRTLRKIQLFSYSDFHINPSCPNPEEEKKLRYIFTFTLLFGASKGYMKAF